MRTGGVLTILLILGIREARSQRLLLPAPEAESASSIQVGPTNVKAPVVARSAKNSLATPVEELGQHISSRGAERDAEPALSKARELAQEDALVAEKLGRICLARNDYKCAISFFQESLQVQPANATLWSILANTAKNISDDGLEITALERALALEPEKLDRRTRLVSLQLDSGRFNEARKNVEPVWRALPRDVTVLAEYAGFLERLKQPESALALWETIRNVDPKEERGYGEAARLLETEGKREEALELLESGLGKLRSSVRIHLARTALLESLGRHYDARRAIADAAKDAPEIPVLRRRAEIEDTYGIGSAEAWQMLLQKLVESNAPKAELQAIAAKGRLAALRDGEVDSAQHFVSFLPPKEQNKTRDLRLEAATTAIPGGTEALAFFVRMPRGTPESEFLAEYCNVIAQKFRGSMDKDWEAYRDELLTYFGRLSSLTALGRQTPKGTEFSVEWRNRRWQGNSEKILEMLGIKVHQEKGKFRIEAGENRQQAQRHELLSALGIDDLELEESLNSSRPWTFTIATTRVPVRPDESTWLQALGKPLKSGLPEVFLRAPRLAQIYSGLASTDDRTTAALTKSLVTTRDVNHYSDLISMYGWSMGTGPDGALVPGGKAAFPVWQAQAGIAPSDSNRFFWSLLARDEGMLLAWYAALSSLPAAHQTFFTLTPERARSYYELFRRSPDLAHGPGRRSQTRPFHDFLRDLPLGEDGHVRFPGSPEVWMVAKGQTDTKGTGRLLAKANRIATATREDEILTRLLTESYGARNNRTTEIRKLISVSHIDSLRRRPFTDQEALLLAQNFSEHESVFPYFSVLTELAAPDYEAFLAFSSRTKQMSGGEANLLLNFFHSVTTLLCLLVQHDALEPRSAAALFSELCKKLTAEPKRGDWAVVATDLIRKAVPGQSPAEDLLAKLAGSDGLASQHRKAEMKRVLAFQKIPDPDLMLQAVEHARVLTTQPARATEIARSLEAAAVTIPSLTLANGQKPRWQMRDSLDRYDPKPVLDHIAELKQKAAKKKPNPRDFVSLSSKLLNDLSGPVQLALTSIVYAQYLRPVDLLISDDPWFVRKHQSMVLDSIDSDKARFPDAEMNRSTEGMGTFFRGSMAQFPSTAGELALAGRKIPEGADLQMATQLASLRAAPLGKLREEDLRTLKAYVLAAREWVAKAHDFLEEREKLAESTRGLLSATRRGALLEGLESGAWDRVWNAITPTELFWLGVERLTEKPTDTIPVNLQMLGPLRTEISGDWSPSLTRMAPYEEYTQNLIPRQMSERLSEFNLHLALAADDAGIPAGVLGVAGESVLEQAFTNLKISGTYDWKSPLRAWNIIRPEWIITALADLNK